MRGATLRAERLLVTGALVGLQSEGDGSRIELESSVVRDLRGPPEGARAIGVMARDRGFVRAHRVCIAGVEGASAGANRGARFELSSSVVARARQRPRDHAVGLSANSGATLDVTATRVEDNDGGGVFAGGAGTRVRVVGCVIRGSRALVDEGITAPEGVFGRGFEADDGAGLTASATLAANNAEMGAVAFGVGASLTLTDVIVAGVRPSGRGFGVGVYAIGGASVEGARVAIDGVFGAGVAALPETVTATRATFEDLFVRRVGTSTIRLADNDMTALPEGRSVAYGLHAGPGCVVEATRAVLQGGGYGFFNANGALRVREGVIADQLDGAGAIDLATPATATTLTGVGFVRNARDAIERRSDLPTASSVAPPSDFP